MNAKTIGPSLSPQDVRRQFLRALGLAQAGEVERLAKLLDWSLLKPEDNLLGLVMNRSLWQKVDLSTFVGRNRNQVAAAAYDAFDFDGLDVQSSGGWSIGTDGSSGGGRPYWNKSVFVYPEANLETSEADDGSRAEPSATTKLLMNLTFEPHTWTIHEMLVCDLSGNAVGAHGDLQSLGLQNSVGLRHEDMPGFLSRVIALCRVAGREDLLTRQKPTQRVCGPGMPGPFHSAGLSVMNHTDELLYRLVEEGLMEIAFEATEWGADPNMLVRVLDGRNEKQAHLIDLMEADLGTTQVHKLRAHLAKVQADRALEAIKKETVLANAGALGGVAP